MTWITASGAALLAATVIVGCSPSADTGTPVPGSSSAAEPADASQDAGQCVPVDAPMQEIPARGDGDPQMSIPAPAGWERVTMMDSELIRYTLVNKALTAEAFAPNVGVTLESAPGDLSAQAVFEQQRAGLVNQGGATDLVTTPGTLCGQPAETIDYTGAPVGAAPARPITVLLSALTSGGTTYAVSVTIQTLDPQNPTYQRDKKTILDGFRFLPPGAADPD